MNLYRKIKLYFLRRKRKRLQREREQIKGISDVLKGFGAISFIIGCALEMEDNSLQAQLRRAVQNQDFEQAIILRDKIKRDAKSQRNSETIVPDNQAHQKG